MHERLLTPQLPQVDQLLPSPNHNVSVLHGPNHNVSVLHGPKTTPKQVILDTLNAVDEKEVIQVSVVLRYREGTYSSCISGMETSDLLFHSEVLRQRAVREQWGS